MNHPLLLVTVLLASCGVVKDIGESIETHREHVVADNTVTVTDALARVWPGWSRLTLDRRPQAHEVQLGVNLELACFLQQAQLGPRYHFRRILCYRGTDTKTMRLTGALSAVGAALCAAQIVSSVG